MKKPALFAILLSGVSAAYAPAMFAYGVDSIRIGVSDHNIQVTDPKNANKEPGVNVSGELRFDSPSFLAAFASPHPFVMASMNTEGGTSFAGVGLEWDFEFAEGWRFEPGFGYVLHDGEINNPFPPGMEEAVAFSRNRLLLGSRDLFRTSLVLTRDLEGPWAVQAIYEHLSHGQVLGEGRNQGLDEVGVRLVYNFR